MKLKMGDVVCSKDNPKKLMTVLFVFGELKYLTSNGKSLERQMRRFGFSEGDVQCGFFEKSKYLTPLFKAETLRKISRDNIRPELEAGYTVFLKSNPEQLMSVSFVLGKIKNTSFSFRSREKKLRGVGFTDGDALCHWFDGIEYKQEFLRADWLNIKSADKKCPVLEEDDTVCLKSNPEILMNVHIVLGKTELYYSEKRMVKVMSFFGYTDGDVICKWSNRTKDDKMAFIKAAMLEKMNNISQSDKNIIKFPKHSSITEFNVGDIVYSKENPEILMTVSYVFGKTEVSGSFGQLFDEDSRELGYVDGDVECNCFDELEFKYGCFRKNELKMHSPCITCPEFKVGDIVYLRSSPEVSMTVSFVMKKKSKFFKSNVERIMRAFGFTVGDVQCKWDNQERFFRPEMLAKK